MRERKPEAKNFLLQELGDLVDEQPPSRKDAYPFILAAGERRTDTANTIYWDPAARKRDPVSSLRMSPGDATQLGIETGGRVRPVVLTAWL